MSVVLSEEKGYIRFVSMGSVDDMELKVLGYVLKKAS